MDKLLQTIQPKLKTDEKEKGVPIQQSDDDDVKFYSNEVLVQEQKSKVIFYLPAYFRFKVKNITNIDIQVLSGEVNCVLIFSVYYGSLPEQIVDQFIQKLEIQTTKDQALQLKKGNKGIKFKKEEKKQMFTYTIRMVFHSEIYSDIFWSPFEIINLVITFSLQGVSFNLKDQSYQVKLNCMVPNNELISFVNNISFGCYDLAENLLQADFSNTKTPVFSPHYVVQTKQILSSLLSSTMGDKSKEKIAYYQYAHMKIPFYKYPSSALATIFIPLWLLSLINLGIFFQSIDLGERISSVATLMLAFVAFIPTIHDQIPPNPQIIFVEIMVFLHASTSLFCLLQSLSLRDIDPSTFVFDWSTDFYFLLALFITLTSFIWIATMFLLHKFKWEPSYNLWGAQKESPFIRQKCFNIAADRYFKRRSDVVQLKNWVPKKQQKKEKGDGKKDKKEDKEKKEQKNEDILKFNLFAKATAQKNVDQEKIPLQTMISLPVDSFSKKKEPLSMQRIQSQGHVSLQGQPLKIVHTESRSSISSASSLNPLE